MGRPCKCCIKPPPEPCCLCQRAWNLDTWSVSIFDKTFSGDWLPETQPDPFDRTNGCHARLGAQCHTDDPRSIWDCIIERDWSKPRVVASRGPCCPQCSCFTSFYTPGLLWYGECVFDHPLQGWEQSIKTWYWERGWVQEGHWGQLSINCGTGGWDNSVNFNVIDPYDNSSVVFTFTLYYQASRFYNDSSGFISRFRLLDWDCVYEPPSNVTEASNLVVGDWVYPEPLNDDGSAIKYPPCQPCAYGSTFHPDGKVYPSWPQSTFLGNCPIINELDCPPMPQSPTNPQIPTEDSLIKYTTLYWTNYNPGILGLCDYFFVYDTNEDNVEDGICKYEGRPDLFPPPKNYSATIPSSNRTLSTQYCNGSNASGGTLEGGIGGTRRTETKVLQITYQSDPIKCDNMPCEVKLKRKTGPLPFVSSLYHEIFPARSVKDCSPIPALVKVIPLELILSIGPCSESSDQNVDPPLEESVDAP